MPPTFILILSSYVILIYSNVLLVTEENSLGLDRLLGPILCIVDRKS